MFFKRFNAAIANSSTEKNLKLLFKQELKTALNEIKKASNKGNFESVIFIRGVVLAEVVVELSKLGFKCKPTTMGGINESASYQNPKVSVSWYK